MLMLLYSQIFRKLTHEFSKKLENESRVRRRIKLRKNDAKC